VLRGGQVVALAGHLGAGKTQWVKGLAAGLGIDPDEVHSPTFTLINEYGPAPAGAGAAPARNRLLLYHVDAYRLAGAAELEAIGFSEMVAAEDGVVAVEWADRVAGLMPPEAIWIEGFMPSQEHPLRRQYKIRASGVTLPETLFQSK
jgi:tRNA threonylcarbamoyladenosine biosynthesis protein TsaE